MYSPDTRARGRKPRHKPHQILWPDSCVRTSFLLLAWSNWHAFRPHGLRLSSILTHGAFQGMRRGQQGMPTELKRFFENLAHEMAVHLSEPGSTQTTGCICCQSTLVLNDKGEITEIHQPCHVKVWNVVVSIVCCPLSCVLGCTISCCLVAAMTCPCCNPGCQECLQKWAEKQKGPKIAPGGVKYGGPPQLEMSR